MAAKSRTKASTLKISYLALVILAALNRETGLLLVAFYALLALRTGQGRAWAVVYAAAYATVTIGVHAVQGSAETCCTIEWTASENLRYLDRLILIPLTFGAFWYMAARGWRRADTVTQTCAILIPPYFAACWIGAMWFETRLIAEMFPLMLALGFRSLQKE